MKKASDYRQHAAECRALAAQMPKREQRDQLLRMAERWEELARDRGEADGVDGEPVDPERSPRP